MPTIEKLSIALPTEMAALVRQAVDGGEYSSQSEVVRDALRDWSYKRSLRGSGLKSLRKAWQESATDDSEGQDADEVMNRLEKKYQALDHFPLRYRARFFASAWAWLIVGRWREHIAMIFGARCCRPTLLARARCGSWRSGSM